MSFNNIESLNKTFSFSDEGSTLRFKMGPGNIPIIAINNEKSSAMLSMQGAHVLSWKFFGQYDVIWLSEDAQFILGKSIRGGIPICWPWFGAHENNELYPMHGFARTVLWEVIDTRQLSESETQISFRLSTKKLDKSIQSMWPEETIVEYRVTVSDTLHLELITYNKSQKDIVVGQALHTYFNVEDITKTTIIGLDGKKYLDKPDNFIEKIQQGVIYIDGEIDRVYLDTVDDITIKTTDRKIVIKKKGSQSTIVWNPGENVASKMGDLGKNGYQKMLCVESANAASDVITIKPASSYTLAVTYEIKN